MLLKYLISLVYACCLLTDEPEYRVFHLEGNAQGTTYHVTYFSADSLVSTVEIDKVFSSLDSSLSLYKPYSLINKFNRSQRGIVADVHLKNVLLKSLEVYEDTGGEFDISVKPLVQAWGFGAIKPATPVDSAGIQSILACVGTSRLSLKGDSIVKSKPCLEIDLNGIAQGYSVDFICKLLEQKKIDNYMVEIGGELRVKGRNKKTNQNFRIGIESPSDSFGSSFKKIVLLESGALTTSGNYRQCRYEGGKKISHLINPKTGYPVINEMISVTVFAKDAITADGFDNAFMGMGLIHTLGFLKNRKDMGAYLIYQKPDGSLADTVAGSFPQILKLQSNE
jgi:FAD:protein FMN transferase